MIEALARVMGYGRQRAVNVPPFSHMVGMTIIKIDARGCMAEKKQLVAIGECVEVIPQRDRFGPQSDNLHILRCVDPLEKDEFEVLAQRCHWRARGVYVEET